jgi:hypothetical protein
MLSPSFSDALFIYRLYMSNAVDLHKFRILHSLQGGGLLLPVSPEQPLNHRIFNGFKLG